MGRIQFGLIVSLFLVNCICLATSEQKWFFNTIVHGKSVSLRPGEACRPWNLDPSFLAEKCKPEADGFRCFAADASYIVTPYDSKDECEEFLASVKRRAK